MSPVRPPPDTRPRFSLGSARQKALAKLDDRARDIMRKALQLHREAPRAGHNLNHLGQLRSAPGDPPAPDYGTLLRLIHTEITAVDEREVTVNYSVMEYGNRVGTIKPRPLGRLTLRAVKADIKGRP